MSGHCKDCRHWMRPTYETKPLSFGTCCVGKDREEQRPPLERLMRVFGSSQYAYVGTHETFGCVLHEPKEGEARMAEETIRARLLRLAEEHRTETVAQSTWERLFEFSAKSSGLPQVVPFDAPDEYFTGEVVAIRWLCRELDRLTAENAELRRRVERIEKIMWPTGDAKETAGPAQRAGALFDRITQPALEISFGDEETEKR